MWLFGPFQPPETGCSSSSYAGGTSNNYDLPSINQPSVLEPPNYASSSSLFSLPSTSSFSTSIPPSRRPGSRRSVSAVQRSSRHHQQDPICVNSSATTAYPSPPSPQFNSKHLYAPPLQRARSQPSELFGILDAPLVMHPDAYAHEKPLSPPLTSPLSTLSLPETRTQAGDECNGCEFQSESDGTPEDGGIMREGEDGGTGEPQARKDTLSRDGEQTLGEMLHSEGARLSPLSPAWNSEMTLVSEDSALLGSSPNSTLAHRRSRGSLVTDRGQPYRRSGPYTAPSSPWTPPQSLSQSISDDLLLEHGPMFPQDPCARVYLPPTPRLTPPREVASSAVVNDVDTLGDSPRTPWSTELSFDELDADDVWVQGPSPSEDYGFHNPFSPLLDLSDTYLAQSRQEFGIFAPPLLDDECPMDIDDAIPASIPSFPQSPAIPLAEPYPDPLPPPCSPTIYMLPDLSFADDEDHPGICSPSRRCFNSLPDLDMEDPLDLEMQGFSDPGTSTSPSPGSSLISLPGVDVDPDLLPAPMPNFTTSPPPQHASSSLLFIDDPQDVPLPRSPSPEDFDLRIPIDDDSDPELAKLFNLRKKSVAAERAARHAEAQLIEAGSVCLRAEATKEKRKNKERSKELGALLRIKLGDKVVPEERPRSASPGGISGISQLVARMLFKRHETFRPLAHRRAGVPDRDYVRSSLSRTAPGFSRAELT